MRNKKVHSGTLSVLPGRGIYTLVVFLPGTLDLKIGELGRRKFPRGYYTYTGSAIGPDDQSLRLRVDRHLRKNKKKHWHIDYLLSNKEVKITAVMAASTTEKRLECEVNRLLMEDLLGEVIIYGFGASDCQSNCRSHLLYFGLEEDLDFRVATLYKKRFSEKATALMFI